MQNTRAKVFKIAKTKTNTLENLYFTAINIKHPGGGYNLDGKIKATNFVQKKAEEHSKPNLTAQPIVKLPTAENFGLTEAKEERLSQIIAEINSRTGKSYDNDVAVKTMLQIRDILLKSDKLKTSAKNNTVKDFEFSYFDDIDDALIEDWSKTKISSRRCSAMMKSKSKCLISLQKRYRRDIQEPKKGIRERFHVQ